MTRSPTSRFAPVVLCATLFAGAGLAGAQTQTAPAAPNAMLSLTELESRVVAQGITVREIELRDLVAEIEGRDAQGREVELLIDRRSGEILSRKVEKK